MGLLQRLSSVRAPARLHAQSTADYNTAFWSGESMIDSWVSSLSAAGVTVTPELAMTLSAMYCGVTTISYDLATLPCQTYKNRDDGGKDLIRGSSSDWLKGGIRDLAYMLAWAPNGFQTATEFFSSQVAQFLLRGRAYAEIVDGPAGFLGQLLPRHPDRVFPERLPNGNLRYKLIEANGQPRYLTQDEMHVVRDLSTDGISSLSRTQYGAGAIGTALAAHRAAGKFFKTGMTASTVATYKGDMEDEDEEQLHKSISRYAAGVENTFGLLLVPDDVTINTLGIEPEKAQMMLAREYGDREVARLLRIPIRKLMIAGTATYASAVQDQIDYVVGCLRPMARTFEQAIQRDLILAKDTYCVRFHLRELLQGDPAQTADFIQKVIASRAMTPSEVRTELLDMNPDPHLDQLSEQDNQPGQAGTKSPKAPPPPANGRSSSLKGTLAVHDNAVRCLRRERAAVEKLAQKYASDVEGWQGALKEFYAEHGKFVAETMRLHPDVGRGYAAQHGSEIAASGIILQTEAWERYEADELCALALSEGDTIDDWFTKRLVASVDTHHHHISAPVTIDPGAVQVDARTTVEGARVDVRPAATTVTIAKGAVALEIKPPPPAAITIKPADVTIAKGAVQVDARTTIAHPTRVKKTVARDPKHPTQITTVTEEYS